jgi:hypothetical protein
VPLDELTLPEGGIFCLAGRRPHAGGCPSGHSDPAGGADRSRCGDILVFGIDARGAEETVARADSLIILTVNRSLGQIQLTSVMLTPRWISPDAAGRTGSMPRMPMAGSAC